MGNSTLDRWLTANPDLLGESIATRYRGKLPYLLKILAADSPLSLQAHPSAEQARKGFAAEQSRGIALDDPKRVFKDDWPKPELLVALKPFKVLAGFRNPQQTVRLFDSLGSEVPLERLLGPLRHRQPMPALAEVFLDCLRPDDDNVSMLNGVLAAAVRRSGDGGEVGAFARLIVQLDEAIQGNPSILAALLLNPVTLDPGQALHVPAGVLHAYLNGAGIEIMASSDNVVRGGLTPKHIDIQALLEIVDFAPRPPEIMAPHPVGTRLARYDTNDDQFALWRIEPGQQATNLLPGSGTGRILLVINGTAELIRTDGTVEGQLAHGQAAFIAAEEQLSLRGDCLAFLAGPGTVR